MIAADIHQTACLDKCNRIVSNFIASPSFRCIYVMTRTLNPAVAKYTKVAQVSEHATGPLVQETNILLETP